MDDIQRRVEDIRKRREQETTAKQNELRDIVLTYQAEAILALESVNFIEELTDDTDLYEYALNKLRTYRIRIDNEFTLSNNVTIVPCKGPQPKSVSKKYVSAVINTPPFKAIDKQSFEAILNQTLTIPLDNQDNCLVIHLIERIRATKSSPEYIEKEIARKAHIAEEARILAAKKAEEERIANEKKAQQELIYRTKVVETANIWIKEFLVTPGYTAISNTFTELTLADWDTRHQYTFIMKLENGNWAHFKIQLNQMEYNVSQAIENNVSNTIKVPWCSVVYPYYGDMPESFSNYFDEGKVPFCTKCPVCKSPTKFNYMKRCHNVHGGMGEQESNEFRQVYCDKHYFHDSPSNTHYIQDINGEEIYFKDLNMPNIIGPWGYICWTPSIKMYPIGCMPSTKWKKWDPTDPDGKRAEAERKEKERDEIKKQIAELYAKLLAI